VTDDCKTNDSITAISIHEEIEQDIINKSVIVKPDERISVATLPFTHDPQPRLHPNRDKALKVYNQQVKKLSSYANDKRDVIESEAKLQKLGHVEFVKNCAESTIKESNPKLHPMEGSVEGQLCYYAMQCCLRCVTSNEQWLQSQFNSRKRYERYEQTC